MVVVVMLNAAMVVAVREAVAVTPAVGVMRMLAVAVVVAVGVTVALAVRLGAVAVGGALADESVTGTLVAVGEIGGVATGEAGAVAETAGVAGVAVVVGLVGVLFDPGMPRCAELYMAKPSPEPRNAAAPPAPRLLNNTAHNTSIGTTRTRITIVAPSPTLPVPRLNTVVHAQAARSPYPRSRSHASGALARTRVRCQRLVAACCPRRSSRT